MILFRIGFFTEKQYMERGARSGGGFAPTRRTVFFSAGLSSPGWTGAVFSGAASFTAVREFTAGFFLTKSSRFSNLDLLNQF